MPARKSTFTMSTARPRATIAKPSIIRKRRPATTSDRICNELPLTYLQLTARPVASSHLRKNAPDGRFGSCDAALTRAQHLLWTPLVALAVLIAHLPSFWHRLMDGDEAVYGSIAALMNTGGVLYAEGGVDNKPPGIFWVYALTFRLFGQYQMTALHPVPRAAAFVTFALVFFFY